MEIFAVRKNRATRDNSDDNFCHVTKIVTVK